MRFCFVTLFLLSTLNVLGQTISFDDLVKVYDTNEVETELFFLKHNFKPKPTVKSNRNLIYNYSKNENTSTEFVVTKTVYLDGKSNINSTIVIYTKNVADYRYYLNVVNEKKFKHLGSNKLYISDRNNHELYNDEFYLDLTSILEGPNSGYFIIHLSRIKNQTTISHLEGNRGNKIKYLHKIPVHPDESKQLNDDIETIASPKEGMRNFKQWIGENIVYPEAAIKAEVYGTVVMTFSIEEDGKMTNMKIVKDIGYSTGEAMLSLFRQYKSIWNPATLNGKPIKSNFSIPIRLDLRADH